MSAVWSARQAWRMSSRTTHHLLFAAILQGGGIGVDLRRYGCWVASLEDEEPHHASLVCADMLQGGASASARGGLGAGERDWRTSSRTTCRVLRATALHRSARPSGGGGPTIGPQVGADRSYRIPDTCGDSSVREGHGPNVGKPTIWCGSRVPHPRPALWQRGPRLGRGQVSGAPGLGVTARHWSARTRFKWGGSGPSQCGSRKPCSRPALWQLGPGLGPHVGNKLVRISGTASQTRAG